MIKEMLSGYTIPNDIHFLALALNIKFLLNWAVVLLQTHHVRLSFHGLFCLSLAVVDSFLATAVSTIYFLQDVYVLGLRVTVHHICVLVQIASFTYSLMHWPIVLLVGLDHCWRLSLHPQPLHCARRLGYAVAVGLVWTAVLLYTFLVSNFYVGIQEEPLALLSLCQVFCNLQSTQVIAVLLLTLTCALIISIPEFWKLLSTEKKVRVHGLFLQLPSSYATPRGILSSRQTLFRILQDFLGTWALYVVLQTAILLLRVDVPAYLDLNVLWLCFLNSFLIGAALWRYSCNLHPQKGTVFEDGFCQWDFFPEFQEVDGHCGEGHTSINVFTLKGLSQLQ